MELTEIEIMKDLLMSEKHLSSAYSLGINESNCPQLRNLLINCFHNTLQCQYEILNAMNQRGWYETKEVDINSLQGLQNKYSKAFTHLY